MLLGHGLENETALAYFPDVELSVVAAEGDNAAVR